MAEQESPVVSIVIPTRNRCITLRRSLDALGRQTYRCFEILVIDDASTDGTPGLLSEFAMATHTGGMTVQTFRNDPQAGANPSRNRGIRAAKGRFICFLDDDCIAEADWLERMMAGFSSDRVGAVTGTVLDPPPGNIFERMLKGAHYVYSSDGVQASRLIGGNMCLRRELITPFMFDEDRARIESEISTSGRGDESNLFLLLRAAGFEQRVVRDAVVLHDHRYTGKTLLRQAYKSGGAHARLERKYGLGLRLELVPLLAMYLSLPLVALYRWAWVIPASCGLVFLIGIYHSERTRKNKSIGEALLVMPIAVAYYHARLVGYVVQHVRLLLGWDRVRRVDVAAAAAKLAGVRSVETTSEADGRGDA